MECRGGLAITACTPTGNLPESVPLIMLRGSSGVKYCYPTFAGSGTFHSTRVPALNPQGQLEQNVDADGPQWEELSHVPCGGDPGGFAPGRSSGATQARGQNPLLSLLWSPIRPQVPQAVSEAQRRPHRESLGLRNLGIMAERGVRASHSASERLC